MPVYMFKCPSCGDKFEEVMDYTTYMKDKEGMFCAICGSLYRRDYAGESATSNFHPTIDVYATSLKRRAGKRKD